MAKQGKLPITIKPDEGEWVWFPDQLTNSRFRRYENRQDVTLLRGAFPIGQNVRFRSIGLPNLREGTTAIGTTMLDTNAVKRAFVYETRNGDQFEIKILADGTIKYWLVDESTDYLTLDSGTANKEWGYAVIDETSDPTNYVFFGNDTDGFKQFNGAWAKVLSKTANTVTLEGSDTFLTKGFINSQILNIYHNFTVGEIVTGTTSGATGTIASVDDGQIELTTSSSSFADGEEIVGGTSNQKAFISSLANKFIYFTLSDNFSVGETVTGTGSGSTAIITEVGGSYILVNTVSAPFTDDEKITGSLSSMTAFIDSTEDTLRSITVAGTAYAYTGGEGTTTLTGIADTTGITIGDLIVQTPFDSKGLSSIKSSVMMAHDGRLHFRDDAKKNISYYSELDNPDSIEHIGTGTDGNAGSKAIEGGGGINAYASLNKALLILKNRTIKILSFTQTGDRIDVPFYQTLTSSDDKGTTVGSISQKSTFSTPLGPVFVTQDKRLVLLTGVTQNNEPQYLVLSDPIQPIFDAGDHSESCGACINNTIYYAFKSTPNSTAPDVLLVGDMSTQTFDQIGQALPVQWDTPMIGQSISDITSIQVDGKTEVHIHSAINSNSYKLTDEDKTDDGTGFVTSIRTWAEHMGYPELWKTIDMVCIVIRMRENSVVKSSILYDENGVSGIIENNLLGSQTTRRYSTQAYNPLGASPFGWQKFGSNAEMEEMGLYRYYIRLTQDIKFFNVSLQLSGDVDGNDFELVRFGYRLKSVDKVIARKLLE